ncbi:molybdenum cofactor guanylyltransferase MobA [Pseudooceanicola nitratireducens]|uniref:molybdenum cofactor guanylyltransferase MobA n=1 Tax=Pseudooceanicola nitratireducens TaxID=517719 RepID=UPI00351186C8
MSAPWVMILAGGASRRMGGTDKALLPLAGRPLIAHVRDRVEPQAGAVAVNTNTPGGLLGIDLPCHPDTLPDRPGPLAGILTAMRWARDHGDQPFVITVPADAPFLPGDLIPRLMLAADAPARHAALAASGGRLHPVCGLWPTALADDLDRAIRSGTRRVTDWTTAIDARTANFPATDPDPFYNVNTPEDLTRAAAYLDGTT